MPRINIDFYSAASGGKYVDMTSVLKSVGDLKPKDRLIDRGTEYSDYLEIVDITGKQVFGGAARVRKTGIPNKFNLNTFQRGDLGIAVDEGLEEVAYFVYDDTLKTLALQRHRLFRSGAWQNLVTELSKTVFVLEPKLRKDKWQRFKKMKRIGSLELSIQRPDQHPSLIDVQPSLGKMLTDASEDGNAFRIDLKFSMSGSRKNSLTPKWVHALVEKFRTQDNLAKFSVTGASDEGRSEHVDFLRDKLVFSAETEYSAKSLSAEESQRLLRAAIDQNKDDLKGLM